MKKNKKEKKNYTVLVGVIIVISLLVGSILLQAIGGNINNTYGGSNDERSGDWQSALASNDLQLIYLGRPTCSWCNKIRPHLNYFERDYSMSFVYINTDETSQSDQDTIFNKLDIDPNEFGTPYLVVIKNGKKIDEQIGFAPEEQLFTFLQRNGLISKDASYKASGITDENGNAVEDDSKYKNIDFIDFNGYKAMHDKGDRSILILGQTGCGYCNKYKPIIDEIAKEKNITINYLDILKLNEEEWNTLMIDLKDYFKDHEQWGTPLTFVIENKKVIASQSGYTEKDTTLKFYKDNKLIK